MKWRTWKRVSQGAVVGDVCEGVKHVELILWDQ